MLLGCGGAAGDDVGETVGDDGPGETMTAGDENSGATGDGDATTGDGDGDGTSGDGDGDGVAPVCDPPITLLDTTSPDAVIGNGTPESCTAADVGAQLQTAASAGGVITFDCGPDPVTVPISTVIDLRIDVDTTIDGGGLVTLDGGDVSQILRFDSPNFRATTTTVTLQRLRFDRGRAPASDFTPDPGNGCAWGYRDGQGGAIYVRDGVLHVIDCVFTNGQAAPSGPDTGGGGIYAVGSLDVTVVGTEFTGNSGSNAGAIGLLQSTGTFVNTRFADNRATGTGANYVEPGCPVFNHDEQGGAGGNGGAMAVDGVEETELAYCGCEFVGNEANEFGGAVFRTPNAAQQRTSFDRCTVEGNTAAGGGGLYISNSLLRVEATTVSSNTATGLGGGIRAELSTELDFVNSTFDANRSSEGLAGALSHSDGGGRIQNCTFSDNLADGGPGLFTAAIRGTTATITNTLFMDNLTEDEFNPMQCWFTPHPGSDNWQWPRQRNNSTIDDTECVVGVQWASADLDPLTDNGGPTATRVPTIALSVGAGSSCPATDQRGQSRPASGCTPGAVQLSP
jgi:predicted outer membrane repeat protein